MSVKTAANAAAHDASSKAHGPVTRIEVGADGIVNLPAGVTPDQLHVEGKDLVVNLADGSQIIIVNGAQNVPTLEMGNVELPGQNVIALLNIEGQPGVQPAAGPGGSSGGNFSTPPGAIDPGFGIDPLLGPTSLQFGTISIQELQQGIKPAEAPPAPTVTPAGPTVIVPASPSTPGGAPPGGVFAPGTQVFEAGLPPHNGLPAGSAFGNGSNVTSNGITYTAPAGLASITINGQTVSVGLTLTTSLGTFQVTAFNLTTGAISYTYTLNTSVNEASVPGDTFRVVVTDTLGQTATGSFTVSVVDDAPIARPDVANDPAGNYAPITGNVENNDTQGADGAHVSGVKAAAASALTAVPAGAAGVTIHGQYGDLTIHQDGSYSYVRAAGTPGGVSDVFNYQLTDGDGSTSSTTLTINIANNTPTLTITPNGPTDAAGHSLVNEAGLANGSHSGGSATATGVLHYTPGDGPETITIGGTAVTAVGQTIVGAHGTLTITSIDAVNHAIGYSYTLTSPLSVAGPGANNEGAGDTFAVVVTDVDGSTATASLVVDVIDDVPTANPDTNAVAAGAYAPVTGNVEDNDVKGADGAAVLGVKTAGAESFTAVAAGAEGTTIHGLYGDLTIHQDGSYSYVRAAGSPGGVSDVFNYQLVDGDGDVSATTLTISIGDATPTVHVPTEGGENALVYEAGLANGSHAGDGSATTSGVISYTPGDGPDTITIGGTVITAVGQTIVGSHGTLTITSLDAVNHTIGYSYTLTSPLSVAGAGANNEGAGDSFAVVVTDMDGSTASGSLNIDVIDDVPTANADTNLVTAGSYAAVTGNVADNDVQGADGAAVMAVKAAASASFTDVASGAGTTISGLYGDLTIQQDGSYSYVRHAGTPGGVNDVFNYQLVDGDGDVSATTLTISIAKDIPTLTIPTEGGAGTLVYEAGLSNGSDPGSSKTTTGAISYTPGDGPDIITISEGGHTLAINTGTGVVTLDNVVVTGANEVLHGAHGVLTITSIDAVNHTIGYSYTLTSPLSVAGPGANNEGAGDSFAVTITDQSATTASGTLNIDVIDDVPTAAADVNSVAAGSYAAVTGNVESNDVQGADGAAVLNVKAVASASFTAVPAGTAGVTIHGQYGDLTIHQDGSYSYARAAGTPGGVSDVFNYQLVDGDGDVSATTLTISIGDATPTLSVTPNGPTDAAGNALVYEAGLSNGSDPGSSKTTTGVISYTPGDGPDTITIGGTNVTTVGQTIVGTHGTLTITSINAANHTIGYSYTLTSPLAVPGDGANNEGAGDSFAVVVTDVDGSTASGSLRIDVIDDVPTANPDTNSVAAGSYAAVSANVMSNDVQGADGAAVLNVKAAGSASFTAVPAGTGVTIHGQYGDLTIHQDGSYTYLRSVGTPGGVSDVFNYQLVDGDGDVSATTLTISIGNASPTLTITPNGPVDAAGNALVYEAGLPNGSHSGSSATTTGVLNYTPGDGPDTITIGGTVVTAVGQTIVGMHGTLTITAIDTVNHKISYSYTLTSPITVGNANDGANNEGAGDTFAVVVTDVDGSTASSSLKVDVIDDVPSFTAAPDSHVGSGAAGAIGNTVGTIVTGALNFLAGADGVGQVITITPNVPSTVTADGHTLVYKTTTVGGITTLTAYEDVNNNGTYDAATDTKVVFTLAIDPSAGASGQYTFTLYHALDPTLYQTAIGYSLISATGPQAYYNLPTAATPGHPSQNVAVAWGQTVTGWNNPTADHVTPWTFSTYTTATTNNSTNGVGVNNQNLDAGELLHFDFGTSSANSAFNGTLVHSATFAFSKTAVVYYQATYVDSAGNPAGIYNAVVPVGQMVSGYNIEAPTGLYLKSVDFYDYSGSAGKVTLGNLTTLSSSVDQTVSFTTTISDGDGDQATSGSFSVEITSAHSPIVLDLNHDGVQFVGESAGHVFNYGYGDVSTAWAAPGDGVLALETAHGPVISFTGFVGGATTDLQGLAAFDTNHNGVLDSGDAEWSHFGAIVNGQFESLSQLGIASINLTSDGQAYTAANGQVQVHGSGTFTYTNGTTGALADASFATQPVSSGSTTSSTSNKSAPTADQSYGDGLAAAAGVVAAAVLGQPQPAEAQAPATHDVTPPVTSAAPTAQADSAPPANAPHSPSVDTSMQPTSSTQPATGDTGHSSSTDTAAQSHSVEGGSAGVQGGPAPTTQASVHDASSGAPDHGVTAPPIKLAILDGTSLPVVKGGADGHQSVQPNGNGPAADGAQPQGQPTTDASGKVAAVVADALHGGGAGGPDLNQLIDTLKGGQPASANDNGGQSAAPQGPVHTGLAYLDLHTGAAEHVNAALQNHHPMVAHDMVSGAHHA